MKIQESAENYLEAILVLGERQGNVRSIDVANELGFSKPSVSYAMKQFRENGLVIMDDNSYLHLTVAGRAIAERTYERHELLNPLLLSLLASVSIPPQRTPAASNMSSARRPSVS